MFIRSFICHVSSICCHVFTSQYTIRKNETRSRCKSCNTKKYSLQVDYSLSTISEEGTPDYSPPHDLGVMINHDLGVVTDEKESVISGPIEVECFAAHVEKFNADRQLLFQEEYEVRVCVCVCVHVCMCVCVRVCVCVCVCVCACV